MDGKAPRMNGSIRPVYLPEPAAGSFQDWFDECPLGPRFVTIGDQGKRTDDRIGVT